MTKIKVILTLVFLVLVSTFTLKFFQKSNSPHLATVILISGLGDDTTINKFLISHWQKQGIKIIVFDTRWKSDEEYKDKLNRLLDVIDKQSVNDNKISLVGTSAGGSLAINAFNNRKQKINKVITICSRLRPGPLNGFRGSIERTKGYLSFAKSIVESENTEKTLSDDDSQKIMTVTARFGDELVPKNTSTIAGAHNIFVPTIEHVFSITSSLTIFSKPLINFLL